MAVSATPAPRRPPPPAVGAGRIAIAVAGLLLIGAYVSMQHVSARSSPVWDEMQFWGIGYYYWHYGRFNIPGSILHPPLSYYLNSLPLMARAIPPKLFDPDLPDLYVADPTRGNQLLHMFGFDTFLASRTPFIVAYCLAGVVVFCWARRWWGNGGGLLSLALYLLCPTLMANGYLMTTDALVAAVGLAALWGVVESLEHPSAWALLLLVGGLALAPAAKITGLLLNPVVAACVVGRLFLPAPAVYVPGRGVRPVSRTQFLLYWTVIGAACAVITWWTLTLFYSGDWRLELFRTAIVRTRAYVERGQAIFLDGRKSVHGFPEYYAKALLYKLPPATIVALAAALAVPTTATRRRACLAVGLAAAVVTYFSFSRYTLGLRYVLLALPLLHVAAGRLLAPGPRSRARRIGALALVAAVALDVGAFYPYTRAYVDRLVVRGPGWTVLSDVDMDWGEGLVALHDYVKQHHLGPIALSYHGSAQPVLFGIETSWLHDHYLFPPVTGVRPTGGLLFVSATNLSAVYMHGNPFGWLRDRPPVAVVGGTIYVYDLDAIPPAERWRQ